MIGGKVGIGTANPTPKLYIVLGPNDTVPPRVESSGTNTFAAGWDFYHGSTGKGFVGVPDPSAGFGAGELILFGGSGTKTSLWAGGTRAVTISNGGVAIGTALIVPGDEALLARIREVADSFGGEVGISAWNGFAMARFCAQDAARLRADMMTVLCRASPAALPRLWLG
jgi:hypothetical protein